MAAGGSWPLLKDRVVETIWVLPPIEIWRRCRRQCKVTPNTYQNRPFCALLQYLISPTGSKTAQGVESSLL